MSNPDENPSAPDGPAEGGAAPKPPANAAEALAEEALRAAQDALTDLADGAAGAKPGRGGSPSPIPLPEFGATGRDARPGAIDLLADVNLNVKIELGRTRMLVEDVLRLGEGSVVELDKLAGDPVDIYVNDRPVARGEVLVLNDNFCVRINEILAQTDG